MRGLFSFASIIAKPMLFRQMDSNGLLPKSFAFILAFCTFFRKIQFFPHAKPCAAAAACPDPA
jgi:hypothetical protein